MLGRRAGIQTAALSETDTQSQPVYLYRPTDVRVNVFLPYFAGETTRTFVDK
jgi:hypothetical protein